eukprot:TRINITY_DN22225_c0_g1_i1.p1 TRINITY_DN22225_c0_g1~~TRINITY_DN22225_c0_g1_i1.p1  ORF type:complete len:256 (+),score=15.40 TRINITY_DN22225_c0_g1_i1:63-830(+)
MRSQSNTLAYFLAIAATLDTLTILSIASVMFTPGRLELTLLLFAHLVLSLSRTSTWFVYVWWPHWFTRGAVLKIMYSCAISASTLFVGCASCAVLIESAASQPSISGSPVQEYYDAVNSRMATLTLYSVVNAMVSISMLVCRFDDRRRESWHRESAPAHLCTLKDVTLRTLVLDDLGVTNKHFDDAGDRVTCCICLCAFLSGEVVSELTCYHQFHRSCLQDWEKSQISHGRSMLCPLRCNMRSHAEVVGADWYEA